MSRNGSLKSLARTGDIHSLTENHKNKRNRVSPEKKAKDSMQPCDELAAIFGVCPKPSFSRVKE